MSKSKKETASVASTLSSIAGGISSESLTKVARQQLRGRNENVPDQLIEMVSHLAEQGGGNVLGMPFDATAARATLAQASDTQTSISVGRQTLQRMEDDMLQQRVTVADPAFAIYTALRRLVKTKAGNALSPAYEQMKSIVKNRPRKSRAKKTGGTTTAAEQQTAAAVPASAPTTNPVAVAPAVPAPSAQAPAPKAVATTSN
jgi:hypothetical protein